MQNKIAKCGDPAIQVICDAVDAQKQGAADVAAALADVKPKVCILISSPDLIFNFFVMHIHI